MKILTVDDSKRIRLPDAKPRQVFSYEPKPDGSIRLIPVVTSEPKTVLGKLVKRKGRLVFALPKGCRLEDGAVARAVREERDSR